MNCSGFQKLISANLDKELTLQEEEILAQHLKICPRCAGFQKELEELEVATSAWQNVQIPSELEREILNRTVKTARKDSPVFSLLRGHYKVPRGLAWASAVLFLMLLINSVLSPLRSVTEAERVETYQPGITRVQTVILTEKDVVKTYNISQNKNNL